jgi:toxin ParE1/3/4
VPRLFLRPSAKADLASISRYIYEQSGSRQIAVEYVRRIRARCAHLLVFPDGGRRRDDLRRGVRIVTFERRVVIAYMVLPTGDVEIGRFFYGGRDYEAIMRGEEQEGER